MPNLLVRILSAGVLAPLILCLVFLSTKFVFVVVISLFAGICAFEFSSMAFSPSSKIQTFLVSLFSALITFSVSFFPAYPFLLLIVYTSILVVGFFFYMFFNLDFDTSLQKLTLFIFGSSYCGLFLGFVGLTFCSQFPEGRYWIFLLILSISLGDTGAYAFGRLFGKKKLAPSLSPGKTWAGSFGGLLATTLSVAVLKITLMPQISWLMLPFLSISLSVFGQLGDLCESFIKRTFGAKDSGNIIPGHGGLLDRIDALMFAAPVVFLFSILN